MLLNLSTNDALFYSFMGVIGLSTYTLWHTCGNTIYGIAIICDFGNGVKPQIKHVSAP